MSRSTHRLLAIGQAMAPTGYARVLHGILGPLRHRFEVTHFGLNCVKPLAADPGWRVEPNRRLGDLFGAEQLPWLLDEVRPDLVFLNFDAWLFGLYREALAGCAQPPRVISYCPVELPPPSPRWAASLTALDRLVFYNEFGRRTMLAAFDQLAAAERPDRLPATDCVPHGVDAQLFHPLDRRQARERLFPGRPELRDAFLVLNANRNVARKRVDLTLEAFAELARDKPDAWLYLHMGMQDRGTDVPALARLLGIADRLLLTTDSPERPEVSDEHLNLIYNACDVGVNTATGEGWGLVAFEHAATGAAQVVPRHSACEEIWEGAGLLLDLAAPQAPPEDPLFGVITTSSLTDTLERLYRDRGFLLERSRAALRHATAPRFSWNRIAERWGEIFEEVLASSPSERSGPSSMPRV
jgi:glycosyltransferase involved in cell wall biosynthesis